METAKDKNFGEKGEVAVTYIQGNEVKLVRGKLISTDEKGFVVIRRRDGIVKINRRHMVKIESQEGSG